MLCAAPAIMYVDVKQAIYELLHVYDKLVIVASFWSASILVDSNGDSGLTWNTVRQCSDAAKALYTCASTNCADICNFKSM